MDLNMRGKTAIITGGVQGIGLEVARELAIAGVHLVLADVKEAAGSAAVRQLRELGVDAAFVRTDLTQADSVRALVNATVQRHGRVDQFVNCAAILDDKTFEESSPADWQRMLNVCLLGPMHCLHTILPVMKQQAYGRIVCFSSDSARGGQARLSYYAAAKAGVTALVKSIAQEVGPSGITANIVSPGATDTPMRQQREAALRSSMGEEKYERRVASVRNMYPLRRIGETTDIAPLVAFLVSDRASWITGQVVSVNGGFTMV
jgi:NAD(P)-dependent dehydrogenase (short-subunit alcohol dehydrogenase family)